MKIIPESEVLGRAVLTRKDQDKVIAREVENILTRAANVRQSLENIVENEHQNIVLKCGLCGEYNNLP